ncbi:MAG TPA: hypothetical protein VF614_06590 [Chthoniobacteraceae bacterium]
MKKILILLWLGVALDTASAITVTDQAGKSVSGEVVRIVADNVVFQAGGQRIPLKLSQLTEESRRELVEAAKVKGVFSPFPPLRVQALVGTQQRRVDTSSYTKQMEISPRVIVEGAGRMDPIPAAEATMLIITMDTRAKYVGRKELLKVHTSETVPVPPAANGERRQIDLAQSSVTYDSWRDKTNVGGAVYKYFIFGLRDPETKMLIDFQTNSSEVAAICKAAPEKREEYLKLATGATFSPDLK